MDREKVIKELQEIVDDCHESGVEEADWVDVDLLEYALNYMKEIVRCRDCLKGEPEPSLKLDPHILCNGKYHPADWFCADGERKE